MQASVLQLEFYFVTDLSLTANRAYSTGKPLDLRLDHLSAEPTFLADKENSNHWQVSLRIKYQPAPDVNAPYHVMLGITGLFELAEGCGEQVREMLIKVNAPSLLFGVAREMIRSLTATGPYPALLLPAVSFMPPSAPK